MCMPGMVKRKKFKFLATSEKGTKFNSKQRRIQFCNTKLNMPYKLLMLFYAI